MKTISFSNDTKRVCMVDDADYEELSKYKWHVTRHQNDTLWYVARAYTFMFRSKRKTKTISMHRHLISPTGKLVVDHIDGNGLNNQRINLRAVTHSQNMLNRRCSKHDKHGVYILASGRWVAVITINGRHRKFGGYNDEHAARRVYDEHRAIAKAMRESNKKQLQEM